jgi:hypothetical protein
MATTESKSQPQIVYEAVQEVMAGQTKDGGTANKSVAFEEVAKLLDKSPATVATAFYRHARTVPNSGVEHRPRGRRGRQSGNSNRRTSTPAMPAGNATPAMPKTNNDGSMPVSEQLVHQAESFEAQAKALREMSALVRETEQMNASLAAKVQKITAAIS